MPEKNMTDLERALSALAPAPATFNRDALLFRAGQASVPPGRVWPLVALGTSAFALTLTLLLVLQPALAPVVHYVHVPTHVSPATAAATLAPAQEPGPLVTPAANMQAPALSYWNMQQQALRFGVENLPSCIPASEDQAADPAAHPAASDLLDFSVGARPTLFPLPSNKSGE